MKAKIPMIKITDVFSEGVFIKSGIKNKIAISLKARCPKPQPSDKLHHEL